MKFFFLRLIAANCILCSAMLAQFKVAEVIPIRSAQAVFNRYGFDPDKDVKFDISDLQAYSIEIGRESNRLTVLLGALIWLGAAGLVFAVLKYSGKPKLNKRQLLLNSWEKALNRGDTLTQAEIELELKDLAESEQR